ncbi:hypothetical protein DFH08DRAFT_941965 [Mycena albidolilacea]|uniref:Uncharacterized protein n=1 Tax=Mycena albidolilacea TaxID=1033008 RepID=A0AAD6ZGI7_9AGAR|nr:hypothetical protein DFH08DRAFT_941965 [Mycena albidolilacea]
MISQYFPPLPLCYVGKAPPLADGSSNLDNGPKPKPTPAPNKASLAVLTLSSSTFTCNTSLPPFPSSQTTPRLGGILPSSSPVPASFRWPLVMMPNKKPGKRHHKLADKAYGAGASSGRKARCDECEESRDPTHIQRGGRRSLRENWRSVMVLMGAYGKVRFRYTRESSGGEGLGIAAAPPSTASSPSQPNRNKRRTAPAPRPRSQSNPSTFNTSSFHSLHPASIQVALYVPRNVVQVFLLHFKSFFSISWPCPNPLSKRRRGGSLRGTSQREALSKDAANQIPIWVKG